MIKALIKLVLRKLAVRNNVVFGDNLHVGLGTVVWAPQRLTIGNDVYIGKNTTIQVDGSIGDNVLIANSVGIVGKTDHETRTVGIPIRHAEWVGENPTALSRPTRVGSDVWIGYGAIVLSGVTIGDSSIIAAGSVVTRDVAPNTIVAGSPASFRKHRFSEMEFEIHWAELNKRGIFRLSESG